MVATGQPVGIGAEPSNVTSAKDHWIFIGFRTQEVQVGISVLPSKFRA